MKWRKRFGVIILALFLLTAGAALAKSVSAAGKIPAGSTVGGVEVGGMDLSEAQRLLAEKAAEWKREGRLVVSFSGDDLVIPNENVVFDIRQTMENVKQRMERPWYKFFGKGEEFHIPFVVEIQMEKEELAGWPPAVDAEKTLALAEEQAGVLGDKTIRAVMNEKAETKTVASARWDVPEEFFLEKWVNKLNGLEIGPKEKFSFNENLMKKVPAANAKEGSYLAAMMYALFLETNLEILERHPHRTFPDYAEPGIDAYVDESLQKDFIVYNPNDFSYTLRAELSGPKLTLSLLSVEQPAVYEWETEKEVLPFRTVYRYSKDLHPGEEITVQKGQNGARIIVNRLWKTPDGETLKTERISRDYYPPVPEIILRPASDLNETSGEEAEPAGEPQGNGGPEGNQAPEAEGTGGETGTSAPEGNETADQAPDGKTGDAAGEEPLYEDPNYVK